MSDVATACACGACLDCTGGAVPTGPAVADPLLFRHGAIKRRMLERIGAIEIDGALPLEDLTTRDDDDPSIALIDAFAGSLHILAWNAGRLSDDGSLPRTEDPDALVDLARLVGYEPRPALAATTTLAFTLADLEGAPKIAKIPQGTKVASVPRQDETPQTFETDADLDARAEWNALKPVLMPQMPTVSAKTTSITLAGTATSAKSGDIVLVYLGLQRQQQKPEIEWLCARVAKVTRQSDLQPPRTQLDLTAGVALPVVKALDHAGTKNTVIILGQRAAAFGATAPDLELMSDDVRKSQKKDPADANEALPTEWKGLHMPAGGTADGGTVDLDAVYPDALKDRFVLFTAEIKAGTTRQIGRITASTELARKGFGLTAKVTRVKLEGIDLAPPGQIVDLLHPGFYELVRDTTIYIETARDTLLVVDTDEALPSGATDRLVVQGTVNLPVGRRLVLIGEQWTKAGASGAPVSEMVTLKSLAAAGSNTTLVFDQAIQSRYRSLTLTLAGNCVGASQGETPVTGAELIGSGNASTATPRFALKRSPLAYVPATNPRGYAPAIEVRVDDRLYDEVPTLFGRDSSERVYTVKTVRGGKPEVQFAGRLPSGTHNVSALYRAGGGKAGNLPVGRVTTALAPVIGVSSVINPVAAGGASDAESVEDMRAAAPQSLRTLDRVVSLADFEAFARRYRGIGKAIATELHVGMRRVVCITIATVELAAPGSDLIGSLRDALALVTPPGRSIRIAGFTDLTAQITLALAVDPSVRRPDAETAVRARLGSVFGRAARNFGEALPRSAVLAAVQSVAGVIAARLDVFTLPGGPPESEGRLLCPGAAMTGGTFTQAGLLSIDPAAVQFTEMLP